jgi:hypothetical protein
MKILCNYTPCGPSYVRNGWRKVFEAMGHQFRFWQVGTRPAFDVFSEYEPDIYIGTTYETDRAIVKNITSRPHMKVCMFASAWSDYVNTIDKEKYPIVSVTEQERKIIGDLHDATGKPDFVFIHSSGEFISKTMDGWKTLGILPLGILNAADIYAYRPATPKPEYECDVAFVGGYWGYKSRNLNPYMLPLCHPKNCLSVKIFGNQRWPVAQYLGGIPDEEVPHLFSSAKVCPNISEPHSTDLGFDAIERPFKVMSSGGFCISDYVQEFRDLFTPEELVMVSDPEDFRDTIHWFIARPERREPFIYNGMIKTLREHTYFDRVAQMLQNLGLVDESIRCKHLKQEYIASIYPEGIVNDCQFDTARTDDQSPTCLEQP